MLSLYLYVAGLPAALTVFKDAPSQRIGWFLALTWPMTMPITLAYGAYQRRQRGI